MVKAINWPACFKNEVIAESTEKLCAAFRIGRLYYDNHYWVDGDEVYVRVNHRVIRKAVIKGDMKCCPVKDLDFKDYDAQKSSLKTMDAVIKFLSETYSQEVNPQTEVSIVYYQNYPIDPEILDIQDDPHLG